MYINICILCVYSIITTVINPIDEPTCVLLQLGCGRHCVYVAPLIYLRTTLIN